MRYQISFEHHYKSVFTIILIFLSVISVSARSTEIIEKLNKICRENGFPEAIVDVDNPKHRPLSKDLNPYEDPAIVQGEDDLIQSGVVAKDKGGNLYVGRNDDDVVNDLNNRLEMNLKVNSRSFEEESTLCKAVKQKKTRVLDYWKTLAWILCNKLSNDWGQGLEALAAEKKEQGVTEDSPNIFQEILNLKGDGIEESLVSSYEQYVQSMNATVLAEAKLMAFHGGLHQRDINNHVASIKSTPPISEQDFIVEIKEGCAKNPVNFTYYIHNERPVSGEAAMANLIYVEAGAANHQATNDERESKLYIDQVKGAKNVSSSLDRNYKDIKNKEDVIKLDKWLSEILVKGYVNETVRGVLEGSSSR